MIDAERIENAQKKVRAGIYAKAPRYIRTRLDAIAFQDAIDRALRLAEAVSTYRDDEKHWQQGDSGCHGGYWGDAEAELLAIVEEVEAL